MKAFVTGPTGFIGRLLVQRLRDQGVEVIALVRNERHGLPEDIRTVRGDILAPDSLGESGLGCDRLYHLAALITFDPRRREELLRVNGLGTSNVLAAARRWKVERSVAVSSAATIGLTYTKGHVLDEDSLLGEGLAASNPYLASKLAMEREAVVAAVEQTVVIVNPTTVYGPGDWTLNSGTLVREVARAVALPVPPGGSNVVDVDDVVEGVLAAGEHGQSGRRYILGGTNLPVGEIFATIARVVGRRPLLVPVPGWMRAPMAGAAWVAGRLVGSRLLTAQVVSDMFAFKYFSSRRAEQELGWTPRYSFQQTVERAWAFYRQEGLA